MKRGLFSCSGFFRPPFLLGTVSVGLLLSGAFMIAEYSGAAISLAEAESAAAESRKDEEEDERKARGLPDANAAAKMRLQMEEEAEAAAETSPRAPTAPPPNDTCGGAEVIPTTLPALSAGYDITDATTTGDPSFPGSPCASGATPSRSIWFKFTPSVSQAYTFSACATDTASTVDDTVMAVYSSASCSGPFTLLACDDDTCVTEDFQSRVTRSLAAGTSYYIVVWKFSSTAPTAGNTSIQLRTSVASPPANDTCAGTIPLSLNRPVTATFFETSPDYQLAAASPCFPATVGQSANTAAGPDLVYSFTAPSAGKYSFKVWNADGGVNPVLYLSATCPPATPGSPTTVTCTNASNRTATSSVVAEEINCVSMTAGQQIVLFVDQVGPVSGNPFYVQVERCDVQETGANDTPGTANVAACALGGSITPAGDIDFFSVGTPAANSRVFAMIDAATSTSADADLRVTTTTDTLEYDDLNNDDAWGSLGPNLAGTITTGAATFLRVSGFAAGSTHVDPYHLYFVVQPASSQATPEVEPNDTRASAQGAANNYFSGSLAGPAPSTDQDFYGFGANAGDLIYVGLDSDPLRNNTPINAALTLVDSFGATLVSANDGVSASNTTAGTGSLTSTTPNSPAEGLIFRVPTAGTYYVVVTTGTTSATSTGAGDYLLSISKNCAIGGGGIPNPAINLLKLTNGTNNNSPPGPIVPVGSTVTFTYVVTNPGNVPLSGVVVRDDNGTSGSSSDDFNATFTGGDTNGNGLLDTTETWTFAASRVATPGQYTNLGTAIGADSFGTIVSDSNTDNHFGAVPAINVVKRTNGTDNNSPPGPSVPPGSTVTFTYVVTNTGNVRLSGVTVRDDNGTPGNPGDDFNATFSGGDTNGNGFLDTTETFTFTASRIATLGQYTNVGTASGTPPSGSPVSDTDSDNHFGAAPSPTPTPTPTPTPSPTPPTLLGNISTRLRVETGDNVLIGGFIVTGAQPKKVIVRGIGTSLPLADKLENPILELHGPSGLIEPNDNWMDSPNKQAIVDSGVAPTNDLESAIVATLTANGTGYTAILRGVNNTTGIGVVEAYDLDLGADSKLANISTRGFVQTGDNILIAGTIVVGPATRKVIVRAIGPSLPVPGKLGDPTLELRDNNGTLVRENNDWRTDQEAEIMATGIPPTNDSESALVETLSGNNSNYTAIVRGVNNTTGIAVVEIYALEN